MIFELRENDGFVPDIEDGGLGKELSGFIPDGYKWEQLNYGQGEGQVQINNCEWGFYYGGNNSISIILHEGSIDIEDAYIFIGKVKEKIYGEKSITTQILLIGNTVDQKTESWSSHNASGAMGE